MKKTMLKLESLGVIKRNGHYIYTSGNHGNVYFNKDAIFPHTELISELAELIAKQIHKRGIVAGAVIGPAVGGVVLSQWITHHLQLLQKNNVLALYADKRAKGSGFIIKRGYDKLVKDKKVIVVEDVINTGGTVVQLVEEVRAKGGQPVAVACLCNRGGRTAADLGVPNLINLLELDLNIYLPEQCKLCQAGVPIDTNLGKASR